MFAATVSESSFSIGNLDHMWERIQTHVFPKLRLPEAPTEGADTDTSGPQQLCWGKGSEPRQGLIRIFALCIGKNRASRGKLSLIL